MLCDNDNAVQIYMPAGGKQEEDEIPQISVRQKQYQREIDNSSSMDVEVVDGLKLNLDPYRRVSPLRKSLSGANSP